jgi:hypothetical protein
MAQEKKNNEKTSDRRRMILRTAAIAALSLAGIALVSAGLYQAHEYVDTKVAYSAEPPQIEIKNPPAWMTDLLYSQIVAAARPPHGGSALSSQFIKEVKITLENNIRTNAWIKEIRQLRLEYRNHPGDTLVLDCEFRAPIALVHYHDYYYLVDGDGIALPERYRPDQVSKIVFSADGSMNIRVIEGIGGDRPLPGQKWQGADLAAGLEMAKVLYGKPYAEDLLTINVANFAGREDAREAQIVLMTRRNTQVRWGRPWSSEDRVVEVPSLQKLQAIKSIYEQYGKKVDAGYPWIDLRFDRVTHPVDNPPPQARAR